MMYTSEGLIERFEQHSKQMYTLGSFIVLFVSNKVGTAF